MLQAGTRLGPYEVVAYLDSGGMGDVYRARDTRIRRLVAIKVLGDERANDRGRRARFAREASVIASLTHPNICTLYEFDRVTGPDGTLVEYLAMELLEGDTLAARIRRSPKGMPLAETLSIAIQTADALAAAHARDIVHRDLKPGNIMLTKAGRGRAGAPHVKLLDFGLAKWDTPADGAGQSTITAPITDEATVIGTLPYMAPEQLEGKALDARTDLFAFGAIVYEMLTGRRAFEGTSQATVIGAILERDPPPLAERAPVVPPALDRLVRKCLAKDPERRHHAAEDLADELRGIVEDSGVRPQIPSPPARLTRPWTLAVAAMAVVAIVAAAWRFAGTSVTAPPMRAIPLTSYPGPELDPALSPDGDRVAFTWRGPTGKGTFKLYVKQVDSGDPLLVHEGPGDVFTPAWSPDGQQIAFIQHVGAPFDEPDDGLFLASALGGGTRHLGTLRSDHGLSWSPEGDFLAVSHRETLDERRGIYLLSVRTGERRRLTQPPPGVENDSLPKYSPDGRTLAFVRQSALRGGEVYIVASDGGNARPLTSFGSYTAGFDWTADGKGIVVATYLPGSERTFGLWRVPVPGGAPEPLSVGEQATNPTLSRRGVRLAFQTGSWHRTIWRAGGPAGAPGEGAPRRLIESTVDDIGPAYSPDGQQISFSSSRSGQSEIWIAASDGTGARQLTFLEQLSFMSAWSKDGRHVAFYSVRDGNVDIYVVSSAGGIPVRLTTDASIEASPTWSRDGRVYFTSNRSGEITLWKISREGGTPTQVTADRVVSPKESVDGRFVYFTKRTPEGDGPFGIWRIPAGGGREEQVTQHGYGIMWDLYDAGLCYLKADSDAAPAIECLDFADGSVRAVAAPGDAITFQRLSVSADGRWIAYTVNESESDIMLVENFR